MVESFQFVTVDVGNRVGTTLPATAPLVELRGVSRSYGGVQAVAEMSFAIRSGTVHALVGENGAGKSTLVKILTGIVQPDEGEIAIEGSARRISDPQAAHGLGIVAMYQEPTVFEDLTVAENVFAGRHLRTRFGTVDWGAMRVETARILGELACGHPRLSGGHNRDSAQPMLGWCALRGHRVGGTGA